MFADEQGEVLVLLGGPSAALAGNAGAHIG